MQGAPPTPGLSRSARFSLSALLLLSLALLAHAPSLRSGFILDDYPLVVQNPLVIEPGHWRDIFTTDLFRSPEKAILYRPLVIASFAVTHAPGTAADPLSHHAVNLALHAMCTLLVATALWQLTGQGRLALLAATIFAVHPLGTEAVGCVFARTELMAALGQLAALLCWLAGRGSRRWPLWIAGMVAGLAVGLLSKESAVCMPGVIVAEGVIRRRPWHEVVLWVGAASVVILVYLSWRIHLFGAVAANPQRPELLALINPAATVAWPLRVLLGLALLPFALSKVVFPLTLSLDYSHNQIGTDLSLSTIAAGGLGLLLICATVREALRRPNEAGWTPVPVRIGAAWFLATWILVSNIVYPVSTIFAERLLYFPSIGLFLIAGWALDRLWIAEDGGASHARRVAGVAVAALVIGTLTARAFVRHGDLVDQRTAMLATAESSSRSAKALADAGGVLIGDGIRDRNLESVRMGRDLSRRSVEIYPELAWVWLNLAKAEMTLQRYEEARAALREALARSEYESLIHTEALDLLERLQ